MVKVGVDMKRFIYLISIVAIISVFLFLYHEESLAISKKNNIDNINSNISFTYTKFSSCLSDIKLLLIEMQTFFESDPNSIPDIYNKYYSMLTLLDDKILVLEKEGLELQRLCSDLDNNNKVCFIYTNDILVAKNNIVKVVKQFNDVIILYNDMSLNNYKIFR